MAQNPNCKQRKRLVRNGNKGASFKVRKPTVFKQWSFEVVEYAN